MHFCPMVSENLLCTKRRSVNSYLCVLQYQITSIYILIYKQDLHLELIKGHSLQTTSFDPLQCPKTHQKQDISRRRTQEEGYIEGATACIEVIQQHIARLVHQSDDRVSSQQRKFPLKDHTLNNDSLGVEIDLQCTQCMSLEYPIIFLIF